MPELAVKGFYVASVALALLIVGWGGPAGCLVSTAPAVTAKKDPSHRSGHTRYVFVGAYGGRYGGK